MKRLAYFLLIPLFLISCIKDKNSGRDACHDYIKNHDETGIDCGGSCEPCMTCSDGIKNQDEEGIDCGGSCDVCPTCDDGKKNQNETGIDCGGNCIPCASNACSIPLGFGDIVYLPTPDRRDTINNFYGYVTADNEEGPKMHFSFDFFPRGSSWMYCNGFNLDLYSRAILASDIMTTQVFTTGNPDHVPDAAFVSNLCVFTIDMPITDLIIPAGEKIYVTKMGTNQFNIKFCNLPVPKTSDYTFNTKFSANINFTF